MTQRLIKHEPQTAEEVERGLRLDVQCPFCGAAPGASCLSKNGTYIGYYLHDGRGVRRDGYRDGWRAGYAAALADVQHRLADLTSLSGEH